MIYNLEFVTGHGLYQLHLDVLNFFNEAQYITRFNAEVLFTNQLKSVVDDSPSLSRKFKAVFKALNRTGVNKTRVFDYVSINNEIQKIVSDRTFVLKTLPNTATYSQLMQAIRNLYNFLWTETIGTVTCDTNYGSIDDHYTQFYNANRTKKICAFCGLEKIKRLAEQRNEYDHYLYKASYPWASINFANLVPMCGSCNKSPNKGQKDMVVNETTNARRLAYYPYSAVKKINIDTTCTNLFASTERFTTSIYPNVNSQAFTTWKEVFRIKVRYEDYIKDEYKNWLINIFNHNKNALPNNVTQLRKAIRSYLAYRSGMARQPGDDLEFSFWNYLATADAVDLRLILTHFEDLETALAA